MSEHVETFEHLCEKALMATHGRQPRNTSRIVVHCQDATYPITDVHLMPDGSIGIEVALHETEEPCNCDQTR